MSRRATVKKASSRPAAGRAGKSASQAELSLRTTAYDAIKHLIITCAFKPGEYINEFQLATRLQIGRTPVHQALDRLLVEEMVEVIPRKGVIVKPISLNEVLQIIEARLINETYCARLAAERADERDIAAMTEVIESARQWTATRNAEKMMLHDREFHLLLAKASGNAALANILRGLHERSLRFWFISLNGQDQHESVQEQHETILAAIAAHQPDKAEQCMRQHIESFRTNVSKFL